jgi:two-component system LytT family response regulator
MSQSIKAIIVDDEPSARRVLRSMLEEQADWITISAEAANGRDAILLINAVKPDLIFLDIQLPDFSGFEVLDQIDHQPNIIFTTAFDQYAMKAFERFSVDYLLKPIREERLTQALRKLKEFGRLGVQEDYADLKKLWEESRPVKKPTAFPIRQGEKIILVRFEKISHFEANGKYVALFTVDGKKYLTDQTLTSLSDNLPSGFLRVQKSYIINKERIREIFKHFNGRYILVMDDTKQSRITTGLTFYETVKQELGL